MNRNVVALILMFSIISLFVVYLRFPQIYFFFSQYSVWAMLVTNIIILGEDGQEKVVRQRSGFYRKGVWVKGHFYNVDAKKLKAKSKQHSKTMKEYWKNAPPERHEQQAEISRAAGYKNKGKSSPFKGMKVEEYMKDPANFRYVHTLIHNRSPRKGKTWKEYFGFEKAKEIGRKISISMKAFHAKKNIRLAEKFYGMKLTVNPGLLRDLIFAHEVLNKKEKFYPYIERNGLREHSYYPLRYPGDKVIVSVPIMISSIEDEIH